MSPRCGNRCDPFGGLTREAFQRLVDAPCARPLGNNAVAGVKSSRGYAAAPGSGPTGETCKSCKHYTHVKYAGTYRKCALMRAIWTAGPGTDIKASAPACARWERG